MPVLAGTRVHIPCLGVLAEQLPAGYRHVQYQAVKVAAENEVAAGTQNELTRPVAAGKLRQLGGRPDFGVERSLPGQGQRRAPFEADGALDEVRQWLGGHGRAQAPGLAQSSGASQCSASERLKPVRCAQSAS